ncbi:MAG: hypothetical protein OT477_03975 [Chloroflexi bacterium]|nr:hypothetical protein [Chloroflexota bacterium]
MFTQGEDNQPLRWQPLFNVSRRTIIGLVLVVALVAFELFNFDTTQYALANLLGDVNFVGLRWATILAVAFCAIDFAGLAHLFTPQTGKDEPIEVWYLMGAWLLGATMNAMMTWWAVSLTLLEHSFGNEVLSREQLLQIVPIFVAALVWLTRILFIGALSVASENLFGAVARPQPSRTPQPILQQQPQPQPQAQTRPQPVAPRPVANQPVPTAPPIRSSRVRQRPPMPPGLNPVGMQAKRR